jgi:predicted  nucleic acid-binding Zn-ribbon protein
LDVNGFLDIAVFMTEDRQLSIALNAYEASNGEIVYSKIITGEPAQTQSEKYSIKEAKYEEEIKSLNTRLTDAEQRAEAAEKLVGELEKTIDELEDELFKTKLRTKSVQDEMDIAINEAATR